MTRLLISQDDTIIFIDKIYTIYSTNTEIYAIYSEHLDKSYSICKNDDSDIINFVKNRLISLLAQNDISIIYISDLVSDANDYINYNKSEQRSTMSDIGNLYLDENNQIIERKKRK